LPSFAFELAPRLYEQIGRNSKFFGDLDQVGFVRFKETH
jgi:hypothetical protein